MGKQKGSRQQYGCGTSSNLSISLASVLLTALLVVIFFFFFPACLRKQHIGDRSTLNGQLDQLSIFSLCCWCRVYPAPKILYQPSLPTLWQTEPLPKHAQYFYSGLAWHMETAGGCGGGGGRWRGCTYTTARSSGCNTGTRSSSPIHRCSSCLAHGTVACSEKDTHTQKKKKNGVIIYSYTVDTGLP